MKSKQAMYGFKIRAGVAALATVLALGIGATRAAAEVVQLGDDGLEVVENAGGTQEPAAVANDGSEDDFVPPAPKVIPELDVKGPKKDGISFMTGVGVGRTVPESEATDLTGKTDGNITLTAGVYYFTKNTTLSGRATIMGNVTIVLFDGVHVTWKEGLHVRRGAALSICGNGMGTGTLTAGASDAFETWQAAIGGEHSDHNGAISICHCHVVAKGGKLGAGIGTAGYTHSYDGVKTCGTSDAIEILDAKVEAYGGEDSAGIGCGYCGECNSIHIANSVVLAKGDGDSAGIGGGPSDALTISIEDSTVIASSEDGAGIGLSAYYTRGGRIAIKDSSVTARSVRGAGIGSGYEHGGNSVMSIEGDCHIDAKSEKGAAIGRGKDGKDTDKLSFSDNLRVISCDDNNKVVNGGERVSYSFYRNHVKVEPVENLS